MSPTTSDRTEDRSAPRIERLHGHTAVVTGGASGIGRAVARRLAAEGAAVAVLDLVDGTDTVQDVTSAGGNAVSYRVDVTEPTQVQGAVAHIEAALGSIDILVNNAGIYPQTALQDITLEQWRHVFAVNVESMLLTTQAFAPSMKDRGWGRIVNVASNSVGMQVPGMAHYIASKMAVIGLTRATATELGEYGITANAIAPSAVRTPGSSAMPEEGFAAIAQMQSVKRTEMPEDLAGTVAFLTSDDAGFVTGQTIYVDGGLVRSC
jgi:(S)-1-phenylethanol dehydrogenase